MNPPTRPPVRLSLPMLVCSLGLLAASGLAAADDTSATVGRDPYLLQIQRSCPDAAGYYRAQLTAIAAQQKAEPRRYSAPALRSALQKMAEADQAARKALMFDKVDWASAEGQAAEARMQAVDAEHLPKIKAIVARHGFPTVAMVGRAGVGAAWLLVQHADGDPAFQAHVLDLLAKPGPHGELPRGDLALLTDRVLLAQGHAQRYATQFLLSDGIWRPLPVEDFDAVDARRAAMDLPPLADYACVLRMQNGGSASVDPLPSAPKPSP